MINKTKINNPKSRFAHNKTKKLTKFIKHNIADFFIEKYNKINNTKLITHHKSYYTSKKRIIVIGDIHGDLDSFIKTLIKAKLIHIPNHIKLPDYKNRTNENMYNYFHNIEWIGDDTYVVQLGDQIDRIRPVDWDENDVAMGDTIKDEGSSLHIFFLIWYLNEIATKNGGRVVSVLGNHEFMNIDGDFRYVSPNEYDEYFKSFNNHYKTHNNNDYPNGYEERLKAFRTGNIISNFFALNYKLVIQVGEWLFVHAGLTNNICSNTSICKINNNISKYLLGYPDIKFKKTYKSIVGTDGDNSPVWNREFGDSIDNDLLLQKKYDSLINLYNKTNYKYHQKNNIPPAKYLAIGHTPQFNFNKGINSICNNKIWRCDVGMSRAFGDNSNNVYRHPQYLEIINNEPVNN